MLFGLLPYLSASIDYNVPHFGGGIGLLVTRRGERTAFVGSVLPFNNKFYFNSGFGTNLVEVDSKVHIVFMSFINMI